MEEGVSVVICCYNSASRLPQTLKHLSVQKTGSLPWEIVLVNNGSTDNTEPVACSLWQEFGCRDIPLKIVNEPRPGLSFARATGTSSSTYDVLIFCDDDNWLEPDYVTEAHTFMFEHPEVGALGGTGLPVSDVALPAWFAKYKYCFACYRQAECDGQLTSATASLYGAGLVIRRQALEKLALKKFEPILSDRTGATLTSGGDTELSFALRLMGYTLWFSEKLNFSHYLPPSRLTEQYLQRLNKSLSYCSGRLIIYKYVLSEKRVTRSVWLKDALYQLFLFFGSLVRYFNLTKPAFDRGMELAFSFFSLKSIVGQFGKYRHYYAKIITLKR